MLGNAARGGSLPRIRSSARIAVYEVAKDSSLGEGKRAMERMDRKAFRLHGEYPLGVSTGRSRNTQSRTSPDARRVPGETRAGVYHDLSIRVKVVDSKPW